MRGAVFFTTLCALVAGLSVVPPEYGRWIAMALLVLLVLTPAVGPRPKARRNQRSEKASSAMQQ